MMLQSCKTLEKEPLVDIRTEKVYYKSYIPVPNEFTETQDPPQIPKIITKSDAKKLIAELIKIVSDLNVKLTQIRIIENKVISEQGVQNVD